LSLAQGLGKMGRFEIGSNELMIEHPPEPDKNIRLLKSVMH
jgi:hypothetical protein